MREYVVALLAVLALVDTPYVRTLTDEELRRLSEELDTALRFVRQERQHREEAQS